MSATCVEHFLTANDANGDILYAFENEMRQLIRDAFYGKLQPLTAKHDFGCSCITSFGVGHALMTEGITAIMVAMGASDDDVENTITDLFERLAELSNQYGN